MDLEGRRPWGYIGIFSSYRKIIDIGKQYLGIVEKLSISKNVQPISSDLFQRTKKRVFHIPDQYQIVFENSAQSCTAVLEEHLGL